MNNNTKQFTWIPFYAELAQALLAYKNRRKELVDWIYKDLSQIKGVGGKPLIDYLHEKDGSHISDIDPFSIFAIFNRATSSRSLFLEAFKTKFHLSESVPTDFDGIPVVDARRSFFFSWEADNKERIETIWALFENVLANQDFSKEFDYLISQPGISYGITMCLFWIRPYTFLSLDSRNREYLNTIGTKITSMPNYDSYTNLIKQIKQKMDNNTIQYKSFPELSFKVWQKNNFNEKVWIWSAGKPQDIVANNYIEAGDWAKDLGDFSRFKTKQELGEAYRKLKNNTSVSMPDTYWKFMKEVSIGDIIVINQNIQPNGKCIHNLYGWGIVESDCEYLTEGDYRIRRKIKWSKPLLDSPIPCTELHNKAFFHETTPEQALHVMQLLGINQNSTQMVKKHKIYIDLLKANHNIILNGAPGTGKTYLAKEIAKEMNATVKMVQFHPSYDYTDFVEGLRPIKDDKGSIGFERKDGVFKDFCKSAIAEPDSPFVFIIDEINRGEISKIFGELFYSIDPGYRGEKGKVQTQYQNLVEEGDVFKEGFYVPENVYIIGTMNDIDRSVESMDFAMRRRFAWLEITAEESAENMGITGDLLDRMNRLNKIIEETEGLGTSYQVGAAMFLKVKKGELTEEELWNLNLKSLMKEYLRGMPDASETLQKMEEAYFLKDSELTNQDN